MCLVKITDLTKQLGLSSRTLRYYEQVGLISSVRPQFETFRYYDEAAVERLHQIMILRKMQIPVKDIIRIYESPEMSTIVEVFTDKISEIDNEVTALSELKSIINTFLQKMVTSGIKKISALPLLYEEMEKQFELIEEERSVTYNDLSEIQERISKPMEPAIVSLPAMRVISSCLKNDSRTSDVADFWRCVQLRGIPAGRPGRHEQFEFQIDSGEAVMLCIADDYRNDSEYMDCRFEGGLYAAANVYVDEDLGERFRSLIKSFDNNKFYEIDYVPGGALRHPALLENLISPDEKRELVCLYVPVKKRVADSSLFNRATELPPNAITIAEIESKNPVLWEANVPLDKITPINHPHYRVLENGEAEYTGWISTRVLNTNVSVKLPFRVDIEFRLAGDDEKFGYGDHEGSIIFYHGEDTGYFAGGQVGQMGFGVNMGNQASDVISERVMRTESISFRQPIFFDLYDFPGRGKINYSGCNHVTWIVGARHLAVIINGEIRYCGIDFPYMSLDLTDSEQRNIVIGSNGQGMKYFRSIRVSQLVYHPKTKLRKEELIMITKQSNNIIPNIHRLVTDEYGENYWFNGCAKYVMESLGEKDFDYNFFAGLTGDVFVQYYPHGEFRGEGVSGYMLFEGPSMCLQKSDDCFELCQGEPCFTEQLFEKCGYSSTFVTNKELHKNTEMYVQTLMSYIDKGVPVISWGFGEPPFCVFVGYEEYGRTLLYITGNNNKPERILLEKALESEIGELGEKSGWIFIGNKKENRPLAEIYREAIFSLPNLLMTNTDTFVFGAGAFRAWADDIESGRFDHVKPEEFDPWASHTAYVCGLATNGSCCHSFLEKAQKLNPDMTFLEEVSRLYRKCEEMWNKDNGKDLEAIGGGFNVTLEALQDKERRSKIAAKLREFAEVTDEIVRVLKQGIEKCEKKDSTEDTAMIELDLVPFPSGAESNGFFAALSSALMPCLGITADTPFWCSPNGSYCKHCRNNCDLRQRHQEMLYHTLLVASGTAFTFDYPEDDDVGFHTLPNTSIGWRWEEPFVANLMDFAGLSYERYTDKTAAEMRELLQNSIDSGYTALCADTHSISENGARAQCWNVVCGYAEDKILVMHYGGEIVSETDSFYSDWIVVTGKAERKQTYRDVLERIYTVLTNPSHDALEQEIYSDLSNVTPENAAGTAYKMMGINGVPIETRWHGAEAFCSTDNLLSSLTEDAAVKLRLSGLFFDRYIANDNNETHGICWKIWGLLHVGPETGYMPAEESFVLIQQPDVQAEMKQLWKIVFDNDRAVAAEIGKVLDEKK